MHDDLEDYKKNMDYLTQMSLENRQTGLKWLGKQNYLVVKNMFKFQKTYFHR